MIPWKPQGVMPKVTQLAAEEPGLACGSRDSRAALLTAVAPASVW